MAEEQLIQNLLLGLVGVLLGYVIWQVQRVNTRFEQLIERDHVHRTEFDTMRNRMDEMQMNIGKIFGTLSLNGGKRG